jgi:hypothetical protein
MIQYRRERRYAQSTSLNTAGRSDDGNECHSDDERHKLAVHFVRSTGSTETLTVGLVGLLT